ncbi:hypothetical protein [Levilactobacillus suantsaiihabitans]|uniref:Uncharacterized protein n=1 Tax=Levilactobacillus suantsaiihabitans TaxID=2487722 RepID=A0A4Z0J6R4_9LACO|nr:hypothetical protein [Levilactobacillus suantsaiihabitans]TGD17610.1 hypothetical protein EGT51_11590 [Levilactobacillus suantsaiihabitans]
MKASADFSSGRFFVDEKWVDEKPKFKEGLSEMKTYPLVTFTNENTGMPGGNSGAKLVVKKAVDNLGDKRVQWIGEKL